MKNVKLQLIPYPIGAQKKTFECRGSIFRIRAIGVAEQKKTGFMHDVRRRINFFCIVTPRTMYHCTSINKM